MKNSPASSRPVQRIDAVGERVAAPEHLHSAVNGGAGETDVGVDVDHRVAVGVGGVEVDGVELSHAAERGAAGA